MANYDLFIYLVIFIAALGTAAFWIYMEKKYKCRIRFRELISGRKIIRDHRAKEVIDKEGVNWWRIGGEKRPLFKLIPAPPEEAIEIDSKGRKSAEAYRTQSGDIIWVRDPHNIKNTPDNLFDDIPEEILAIVNPDERFAEIKKWRRQKLDKWRKENKVLEAFEPFTTKQRMIYIANLKKAESRKGFSWKENIPTIVGLGIAGLVLIALIVFWGDLTKPTLAANQQFIEAQKMQNENLQILKEIKTGIQRVEDSVNKIEPGGVPD